MDSVYIVFNTVSLLNETASSQIIRIRTKKNILTALKGEKYTKRMISYVSQRGPKGEVTDIFMLFLL